MQADRSAAARAPAGQLDTAFSDEVSWKGEPNFKASLQSTWQRSKECRCWRPIPSEQADQYGAGVAAHGGHALSMICFSSTASRPRPNTITEVIAMPTAR